MNGSWLIRASIVFLVVLPPGTFRSLDGLVRDWGRGRCVDKETMLIVSEAPSSFHLEQTDSPVVLADDAPSPDRPFPGRSWSDTTYTIESAPSLIDGSSAFCSSVAVVISEITYRVVPTTFPSTSPRHAHCAPRCALIAACAFLI